MNDTMIVCYIVIAVALFSVAVYAIGRASGEDMGYDVSVIRGPISMALLVSIFWLPILVLALVIIPFFLLYRMGGKARKDSYGKEENVGNFREVIWIRN